MKQNDLNERKTWQHTLMLALTFALLVAVASAGTGGASTKSTIGLVHGAWAEGSSWNAGTSELQEDGYMVNVLANPLRGLSGDAAYIASILNPIPGPIVLVGHSYGGAVIT